MSYDESKRLKELIERKKQIDQEIAKFTKLVTVLFADIVGSTSYFERFGDVQGLVYVHTCIDDYLTPAALKHGGTISKTIGDEIMVYYEDPIAAIHSAIEMQQRLEAYNRNQIEWEQIRVRIGLNYGPGMVKEKDVFGDAVNTAARVEKLAKGDQIMISCTDPTSEGTFSKAWEEKVRATFPVREIRDVKVKGKAEKLLVFEVLWKEMTADKLIEVAPRTPQMAGRVNVAKAAEMPSEKGTAILEVSPVARIHKPKVAYSLVLVRPDGTHGQEYPLDRPTITLGRVEGEILIPNDPLVSRRHARFIVSPDSLAVEDLNSANGIFIRLNRPHVLASGDIILMGRQMFRFVSPRRGAAPPPAATGGSAETATVIGGSPSGDGGATSAELIRLQPGGVEDQHFPLEPGENILGRTRGNLTFPDDAYLSSQHCRIRYQDGVYVLEDLHAVNGTFVAIRERTLLNDGDIVLIGHQLLRVTVTAA